MYNTQGDNMFCSKRRDEPVSDNLRGFRKEKYTAWLRNLMIPLLLRRNIDLRNTFDLRLLIYAKTVSTWQQLVAC